MKKIVDILLEWSILKIEGETKMRSTNTKLGLIANFAKRIKRELKNR